MTSNNINNKNNSNNNNNDDDDDDSYSSKNHPKGPLLILKVYSLRLSQGMAERCPLKATQK